ncbi:MAG TPA: hypothetical protein EYP56_15640 [Planctomycetaceae bacterium]|nr:hypothetical protein [Planctomycetaceae bacterium]
MAWYVCACRLTVAAVVAVSTWRWGWKERWGTGRLGGWGTGRLEDWFANLPTFAEVNFDRC